MVFRCLVFCLAVRWAALGDKDAPFPPSDYLHHDLEGREDCDDDSADSDQVCSHPNHVAVKLKEANDELARAIAEKNGYRVLGRPFLGSHYFFVYVEERTSRRHKRSLFDQLVEHEHVEYAHEQYAKRRKKRDFLELNEKTSNSYLLNRAERKKRRTSGGGGRKGKTTVRLPWPDPLYKDQWYLVRLKYIFLSHHNWSGCVRGCRIASQPT